MYSISSENIDVFRNQQNPLLAEKDYLECVILNRIFEDSFFKDNFIFTGSGTINKTYKISARFSQDIDLAFCDFEDLPDTRSSAKLKRFKIKFNKFVFEDLKQRITKIVKDIDDFTIVTDKQIQLTQSISNHRLAAPALYMFYYSDVKPNTPMCINLQFMPRHYQSEIIEYHTITPYALNKPTTQKIPTVHFAQTFWDKIYALHIVHQIGVMRTGLSTHYYDVVNLAPNVKMNRTKQLFKSVEKYQTIYTTRNIVPLDTLCDVDLMPKSNDLPILQKDYSDVSNSFIGCPESWQSIILGLKKVNAIIHNLNQKDER